MAEARGPPESATGPPRRTAQPHSIGDPDRIGAEPTPEAAALASAAAVAVQLPWPPATNGLYATVGRRRVRTARYDRWLREAGWALRRQRPGQVAGAFKASLVFTAPDARRRDLDGVLKPVLDLLVGNGLIEDDSLARELHLAWSESSPSAPGCVEITLEAVA
jgi:Holliday junction resolvase RusA-like endonuclease